MMRMPSACRRPSDPFRMLGQGIRCHGAGVTAIVSAVLLAACGLGEPIQLDKATSIHASPSRDPKSAASKTIPFVLDTQRVVLAVAFEKPDGAIMADCTCELVKESTIQVALRRRTWCCPRCAASRASDARSPSNMAASSMASMRWYRLSTEVLGGER